MWLAHHFPGLGLTLDALDELTPEQHGALRRAGDKILEGLENDRVTHTKAIMAAAGAKVRL